MSHKCSKHNDGRDESFMTKFKLKTVQYTRNTILKGSYTARKGLGKFNQAAGVIQWTQNNGNLMGIAVYGIDSHTIQSAANRLHFKMKYS